MEPITFRLVMNDAPIGLVTRFNASEELGEIYEVRVEVALHRGDPRPDGSFLDQAMSLEMQRGGVVHRLAGVLFGVRDLGTTETLHRMEYRLRPRLARLALSGGWAARTELSAPTLAKALISEAGYMPEERYEVLTREHATRSLIVQAEEDSLHHLLSVLGGEGLIVAFQHECAREHVAITDCARQYWPSSPTHATAPVRIMEVGWDQADEETLQVLREEAALETDDVELIDRDFTRPERPMRWRAGVARERRRYVRRALGEASWQSYDGERYSRSDGPDRAKVRAWESASRRRVFGGESNLAGLRAGQHLRVAGRVAPEEVETFLVVAVEHDGHAPGVLVEGAHEHDGRVPAYRNRFRCIPEGQPWRPPPGRTRPRMQGITLATVTGVPGAQEEVVTDAHGRVLVRFHWDDCAHRGLSSAWLRVAQAWAGSGFGALFTPRVGSEVCVSFRDGNPDDPIIVGCLYNGADTPWASLPNHRDVSGIRTRTVDRGDGHNELIFADTRGAESLTLGAQRDCTFRTRRDHVWKVGHDRVDEVRRTRTTMVGRDDVHGTVPPRAS